MAKRKRAVFGKPAPTIRTVVKVQQYRGSKYEPGQSRNFTVYRTAEEIAPVVEEALKKMMEPGP